jgi:two-component system cell cycle response regulator
MLDADHFKRVNDDWGHETGNQALQLIANCIRHNVRKLDIACRYGGEEFAVILPSTDMGTAVMVAERIRTAIEEVVFTVGEEETKKSLPLTISLGLSYYSGNRDDSWHKLVERADTELYRAKQSGRNKVCHTVENINEQQVSEDEKTALYDMFRE